MTRPVVPATMLHQVTPSLTRGAVDIRGELLVVLEQEPVRRVGGISIHTQGVVLRLARLPTRPLVAICCSREHARQRALGCFSALRSASEEQVEIAVRVQLTSADRRDHFGRPTVQAGRATRRRRGKDDPPDEVGPDERDLLCDEAAQRETEQVDVTPTLSKVTTRRRAVNESMSAGSQLSRLARKCCRRTSATSPSARPTSRYAYSIELLATIVRFGALV